ncbi:MAG: hypothetical protein ABJO27_17655 [Pseudoruegeria sp.]
MHSKQPFNRHRFSALIFLSAVRMSLRYPLSYQDVADLLGERGVDVDRSTVFRWVQKFGPELAKRTERHLQGTVALLKRLEGEGIADKELSALLARDQLVPIVHNTTYEALRDVSPLLGSRTGLDTAENPMRTVATKLAELIAA